jgi:glycosyltransferase involved in cell wall biosynthesis
MTPVKVTLYRDLPTEGWPSMERYANELSRNLPIVWPCLILKSFVSRPPLIFGTPGTHLTQFWRSIVYPLAARQQQGSVNHIVDHSYAHLLTTLDPRRSMVTCHDLAPLALRPSQKSASISTWLWDWSLRQMLKAAHVVCDSHFTASELVRLTGYPEARTSVAPLGVASEFRPLEHDERLRTHRAQLGINANSHLLLHVGHCGVRKNIMRLLEALGRLRALNKPLLFLQIGGKFTADQNRKIEQLGLRSVVRQLPNVPEGDLPVWYNAADVFVFPSTYEGFGLPVLEAMACGVPVVCSRSGSLPEVAGEAAMLVDAESPDSIASAVATLLDSRVRRQELRFRGLERAAAFTWRRTAERVADVYRFMLSRNTHVTKDVA